MGFWRQQEEKMAARLLQWHFQRQGEKAPEGTSLERMASDLVSKAHEVAKKRGQNVMVIIKELVEDLRR
ncbi:MAG: hypothetical protein QNJ04_10630 [Desulfobacterales bacterium]|nr:hypothetical protein [Desulfobacterales bacterium]